jgi:hypothetical protein
MGTVEGDIHAGRVSPEEAFKKIAEDVRKGRTGSKL